MPFGQPNPYRIGGVELPQESYAPHPMAEAVAPKKGINWLGVLADALAGAAGRPGPYASMMAQQREAQAEEDRYQRHRADSFDMWREQQEYQAAHPAPRQPSETERMIDALTQMAPDDPRRPYYESAVNKPQAVTVTNPDGSQELRFIRPGQVGQAPARPVGKLTPIGGPTPSASGGFR